MIFLLCSFHICLYPKCANLVNGLSEIKFLNLLQLTTKSVSLVFSELIVTVIVGISLYSLIKIQKSKSVFKRISVLAIKIEKRDSFF